MGAVKVDVVVSSIVNTTTACVPFAGVEGTVPQMDIPTPVNANVKAESTFSDREDVLQMKCRNKYNSAGDSKSVYPGTPPAYRL